MRTMHTVRGTSGLKQDPLRCGWKENPRSSAGAAELGICRCFKAVLFYIQHTVLLSRTSCLAHSSLQKHSRTVFLLLSYVHTVSAALSKCSVDPVGSMAVVSEPPSTHRSESLHTLARRLILYVWFAFQNIVRQVVLSFWSKQNGFQNDRCSLPFSKFQFQ